MFKKSQRLTRSEFDGFFKSGKRNNFQHLTIIHVPHPTLKVSVVVGKKVSKQAVRRNTLKRRILASSKTIFSKKETTGIFIFLIKPTFNSLTRVAADEFLTESIVQLLKNT